MKISINHVFQVKGRRFVRILYLLPLLCYNHSFANKQYYSSKTAVFDLKSPTRKENAKIILSPQFLVLPYGSPQIS